MDRPLIWTRLTQLLRLSVYTVRSSVPPTPPNPTCVRICFYLCCLPAVAKVKRVNRSSCASCAVAAGAVDAAEVRGVDSLAAAAAAAAGSSHRVAFSRGVPSPRQQQQRRQSGRRAAEAVGEVEGRGGRAVPFLATGRGGAGAGSYNVISAVSKAMRTARRGRPREVRGWFVVGGVVCVVCRWHGRRDATRRDMTCGR